MSEQQSMTSKPRVLSGMRPTGKLHLGNYMGALANWVKLQDSGLYECYFFIADWHALTTDYADPSQIRKNIAEVALDYLGAGLDPEKSTLFIQSYVPQHAELHLLLSMVTSLGWLERVPTYKEQQENLAGKELTTYGFLGYPLLQSADILIYQPRFVPVGQDQVSHVELTREVARRFNSIYKGNIFPEPDHLLTPSPKLPGTDGRKMSKSYGNTIGLTDSTKQIFEKLEKMTNGGQRNHVSDPGDPEICPVYDLHKVFSSETIKAETNLACRTAKISCAECKQIAARSIDEYLEPIRRRRSEYELKPNDVNQIFEDGAQRASKRAEETMRLVRDAMGIARGIPVARINAFDRYSYDTSQPMQYSLENFAEEIRSVSPEAQRKFLIDFWKNQMLPSEYQLKQLDDNSFVTLRNKRVFVAAAVTMDNQIGTQMFEYAIPNKNFEVLAFITADVTSNKVNAFVIPQKEFSFDFALERKPLKKSDVIKAYIRKTTGNLYQWSMADKAGRSAGQFQNVYEPLK